MFYLTSLVPTLGFLDLGAQDTLPKHPSCSHLLTWAFLHLHSVLSCDL